MNKLILRSALVLSLAGEMSDSFGKSLTVDQNKSGVQFKIKHMLFATLEGKFKDFSGTIDKDDSNFLNSKVSFVVRPESVDTENSKRDEHLRTADFFDVKKYPEAKFISTKIEAAGENKFNLFGELSVHGKSKSVKFELIEKEVKGEDVIYEASTHLNRLDFAVGESSMMVDDEVNLIVRLHVAGK